MRLAVWHDPPPGGARRAFDELLSRLSERHSIGVFQLTSDIRRLEAPEYAHRFWPVEFEPSAHRRAAPYWNDWLTVRDLQRLVRLERTVAGQIDAGGFDAVLVSVLRTALAPALPRFLRTVSAYYCHEPPRRFYEQWCRPEAGPLTIYERARAVWRRPAQAYIDAWSRRTDIANVVAVGSLLTNSHYTAERMQTVYGRSAQVCYLGVDGDRFRPIAPGSPTRVLSVGTLEAHKGFDFLIRALGCIDQRHRPSLTIVGRGGHPRMPAVLRRQAADAHVQLDLRVNVSDGQLAELYRSHAVFVFAARHEPFGLVILEALASGLPVIAIDEGGVRESVRQGETGYLVPRDAALFGATVKRLLVEQTVRTAMGRAARDDMLEHWTWDAATRRVERLLEQATVNAATRSGACVGPTDSVL